jgi:hypothetical protein
MDPVILGFYAEMCAATLAKAHARSGDAVTLAAYLGKGGALGEAMVDFAAAYADLNERDHADAVARWGLGATSGPEAGA